MAISDRHSDAHSEGVRGDRIVDAAGLTKTFSDFWMRDTARAVDGIDFHIDRHEIFGLLGPNGSGKSTTIKMILGLLHKTRGKLVVFGRDPSDVAVKNLAAEGITRGVHIVGDVMQDVLTWASERAQATTAEFLSKMQLQEKSYVLATVHRDRKSTRLNSSHRT